MRLSDFAPRINGVIPVGVHGLGIVGLADLVQQDLLSWVNYPGGGGTPAAFNAALMSDVQGYCANWPDQCSGVDIAGLVASATASYASWYNGQPLPPSATSTMPGYTAAPPPGYQYNPYTGALEQIPNAIQANAPPPNQPPIVTQTGGNVLNPPPVAPPPVTSGQVQNTQTQSGSTALANGTSGSNVPAPSNQIMGWLTQPISTSIPIPMWAVLAGGVTLVLVMKD